MNLNQVRDYTKQVIAALHAAGWHTEGFALGNDLISIGYQPLPKDYLMVLEDAERMAEQLEANGFGVPLAA